MVHIDTIIFISSSLRIMLAMFFGRFPASLEPVRRLLRPRRVRIAGVQEIKRLLADAACLVGGATVASGAHKQVKRLRHAAVLRTFLCPLENNPPEVNRGSADGRQVAPLLLRAGTLGFGQKRW